MYLTTFTSPVVKQKTLFVTNTFTTSTVLDSLHNSSIIDYYVFILTDRIVEILLRRKPISQELQIPKESNFINISVQLRTKQPLQTIVVSIPEGLTIFEVASLFKNKMNIDSSNFVSLCYDQKYIDSLEINSYSLEGFLYPNTYEFYLNSTPQSVIKRLTKEFNKVWLKHCSSIESTKQLEILTLASIVEAETPVETERKRVAGVYKNRLDKGMKLEADPTVQYALKSKKRLLFKDLEIKNPYNTYMYKGLPPGPINSPSISSILASINPEKHQFIFFVARGDKSNQHYFSTSYSQHLESVALYRARNK